MQTECTGAAGLIEATLSAAQASIGATGAKSYAPFVHLERTELAGSLADEAAWRRELGEARRLFTEMGATAHAEPPTKELATCRTWQPAATQRGAGHRKDAGRRP